VNEQARKPEREAVLWSIWKHIESHRNDVAPSNRSNKDDNNDPCMLRHTAGCSLTDRANNKSWVIDLEACDYAIAA
jgi:hypothetical protein